MDIFTELYREAQDSHQYKVARAEVAALGATRNALGAYIRLGKTQTERQLRLSLTERDMLSIISSVSEQYGVSIYEIYDNVYNKLAAETAVTEPNRVDPKSGIGGDEGKKYQGMSDDKPDATTDIVDPDPMKNDEAVAPVLEDQPVRHKLKHNDKMDSAPETKHGPGAKGKSFPNTSAVTKTAAHDDLRDAYMAGYVAGSYNPATDLNEMRHPNDSKDDPEQLFEEWLSDTLMEQKLRTPRSSAVTKTASDPISDLEKVIAYVQSTSNDPQMLSDLEKVADFLRNSERYGPGEPDDELGYEGFQDQLYGGTSDDEPDRRPDDRY